MLVNDGVLLADVRAQAANALVNGDTTASMAVTADTSVDPPAAPATLSVAVVSTRQLNLSWKDMSADEHGFVIERCTGSTCTNFAEVARAGAGATSFPNTGLVKATTYRYRVRAYNSAAGSAYTSIVNGTTKSR